MELSTYFAGPAVALACLVIASALPMRAQSEVSVYGGGTHYGTGGGSHAVFGGSFGYNTSERSQVFAEANYTPLGSSLVFSDLSSSASGSSHAINFGAGALYGFGSNAKARPYVSAVVGDALYSTSYSYSLYGVSSSGSVSSNELYAGAGLGVRIFAGRSWGIKPEFRYQRYLQNGGANVLQFTAGIFFQMGK